MVNRATSKRGQFTTGGLHSQCTIWNEYFFSDINLVFLQLITVSPLQTHLLFFIYPNRSYTQLGGSSWKGTSTCHFFSEYKTKVNTSFIIRHSAKKQHYRFCLHILHTSQLSRGKHATQATSWRVIGQESIQLLVLWLGMHYMYYCKFLKIDVAEEKGMTMNSSEGLKLVMWKIDHSEFVKIIAKFSENCFLLNSLFKCHCTCSCHTNKSVPSDLHTGCLTSNIATDLVSWKLCAQRGIV